MKCDDALTATAISAGIYLSFNVGRIAPSISIPAIVVHLEIS